MSKSIQNEAKNIFQNETIIIYIEILKSLAKELNDVYKINQKAIHLIAPF